MKISAIHFPYNTNVVTKKQFDEHYKLYKGYVDKTNEITELLASKPDEGSANATYSYFRGLKCGETYAIDGVILHEAYFQNMGEEKLAPCPKTEEMLQKCFGGFEKWRENMIACGKAARGWAVLVYEQRTESFRNIDLDLHNEGVICMAYPLVVMDMYEHAYFMDYGTDKEKYIKKFIERIDWPVVEKRLERMQAS